MKWRELAPFLRGFGTGQLTTSLVELPVRSFPFPSPLNDPGSVLAVKGPLRRVPRPGPLRTDPKKGCLRGKRAVGVSGRVRAERNLSAIPAP